MAVTRSAKEDVGIDKVKSIVHQLIEQMLEKLPISNMKQSSPALTAAAVSESDAKKDEKTSVTIARENLDLTKESDRNKAIQLIDKMLDEILPIPYPTTKEDLDKFAFKFREKESSTTTTTAVAIESDVKADEKSSAKEANKAAIIDKKIENTQPISTMFSLFSSPTIQKNAKQAEDSDRIALLQQRLSLLNHSGWVGNEDLRLELQKRIGKEMMQLGKILYDQATRQKKYFSSVANSF